MSASFLRGNLHFTAIIIVALMLLMLIPGIALGQDNNDNDQEEPIDEGNGFFENISTFVWILGGTLLVIIILLVFLVGRSRGI